MGLTPFDHGAQYVTAKDDRFKGFLDEIVNSGYAARWPAKGATGEDADTPAQPWIVGTPGMASIVRPLAESVRIHTSRNVHTVKRVDKAWYVWFDDQTSAGPFAAVGITVPAFEARLLLGDLDNLADQLAKVFMAPCWALTIIFEEQVLPDADVYSDMSQVIRWVSRNNSKPGRTSRGETVVVHAAPSWTRETEDAEPELVAQELWAEVCRVMSLPRVEPAQMQAHLWRHALTDTALGESFLYQREQMIGVGGDWCRGRVAEHAYLSGLGLGKAMVDSLT
jgi:hypothetical protein